MRDNEISVVESTLQTLGVEPTADELEIISAGYRTIVTSMSVLHESDVAGVEPLTIPRLPDECWEH